MIKNNKILIKEIVDFLGSEVINIHGNYQNKYITEVSSLIEACSTSLVWIKYDNENYIENLKNCKSNFIISSTAITKFDDADSRIFIQTENPKLAISKVIQHFFVEKYEEGIHNSSTIHPEAKIGKNVYIGPNCYIGKAIIGDDCVIIGNSFINDSVKIGDRVEIHVGCVIGDVGSGYSKDKEGRLIKFPHIGEVIIEDDVEIGALSYINRGSLSNTHLKKGVKIGNAVCIGHNVEIGENTIVIANSVIAGSTKVGKNVWIAHSCTIRNGIEICDNAIIGMGSVVTKTISSDQCVLGNPAQEISLQKKWLRLKKEMLKET
jgi:UDP-3-O-[3-hydroxymyristoyl] glucosamine N-acyltransferase